MTSPTSTYRLQITERFTLDDATAVVDYLHDLGAGWLYLSPILTAEAGSAHGYDIIDHAAVDPARGGPDGLLMLSTAAHAAGMGVIADIVPNHVGIASPPTSRWWWDLLTHGPDSPHAARFDVEWDAACRKVRLPILGDEPTPELAVVDGQLRYHEHRFPLAPGTDTSAPIAEILAAQHYELVNWRRADAELNYRRFFGISSLAGIRVEDPTVFEESHREIRRWVQDGLVDGLRVDHVDGLAEPGRYLHDLRAATGVGYVVVEKILQRDERLPDSWDVEGTTGYDALADFDRVLIDSRGRDTLDRVDVALYGGAAPTWNDLVHRAKRAVTDGPLRSEVLRLTRQLGDPSRSADAAEADRVADGVAELLTCFPVYRSYLPIGVEHLRRAVRSAHHYRPDLDDVIADLVPVLADPDEPSAVRFQQTSGMVMAKGVEDCAFYRHNRLGTLTEVGGDPSEFSIDVAEFHRRQRRRLHHHPRSMTTLTTHDTKRSEDARARISVLAEMADEWAETFVRLRQLSPPPDGPLAELIWQAAIGAWPLCRDRLSAYALKAAREAGTSTSWTTPDPRFERAVQEMVDDAYDHRDVVEELERIVDLVRPPGWSNSLAAKLIQLTAPGVPDVYQGSELWDTSLVDPDNRRPIDFATRRALLAAIRSTLPPVDDTGAAKLLVTTTALRYRRDRPDLFTDYTPVDGDGAAAEHLVAFDRGGALTIATRLPVGLRRSGGWRDTVVHLDGRDRVDAITGRPVAHGTPRLGDILHDYPVALLVPTDAWPLPPGTGEP